MNFQSLFLVGRQYCQLVSTSSCLSKTRIYDASYHNVFQDMSIELIVHEAKSCWISFFGSIIQYTSVQRGNPAIFIITSKEMMQEAASDLLNFLPAPSNKRLPAWVLRGGVLTPPPLTVCMFKIIGVHFSEQTVKDLLQEPNETFRNLIVSFPLSVTLSHSSFVFVMLAVLGLFFAKILI